MVAIYLTVTFVREAIGFLGVVYINGVAMYPESKNGLWKS
jgi:hypothetical protein